MSTKPAVDSDSGPFGRFGYPRETTQNTAPWDPEMARSMASTNAHIEAQRLRTEAEMNTPENRKKAAEAAEAELAEKRRAWGTRAWALPMDGFKGIRDSAKDKELKIYTRTYDLKHKFWGIKPVGMTIWNFWDIHDPQVSRYNDANQETPATPEPPMVAPAPTNSSQTNKSTAKPRSRQNSSKINPTHRVTKSSTPSPKVNKKTRKSLANKIEAGHSRLQDQVREVREVSHTSGRPIRNKTAVTASSSQQKKATEDERSARPRGRPVAKAKPAVKEEPVPSKRPRGRPPVKKKPTERLPMQSKAPAIKGNARVTKSQQSTRPRPAAPSAHKMRTRAKGPAELLSLP